MAVKPVWQTGLNFAVKQLLHSLYEIRAEKVLVSLDWSSLPQKIKGHLQIDRPHIQYREFNSLNNKWLDFTVSLRDATVIWDESVLLLNAELGKNEWQVDAEFEDLQAPLLNEWMPWGKWIDGKFTGRTNFTFENGGMQKGSARISVKEGALGPFDQVEGSFSYHSGLGMKWDAKGIAGAIPLVWQGRCYTPLQRANWIESEITLGSAQCFIQGEVHEGEHTLHGEWNGLSAKEGAILQIFGMGEELGWREGVVDGLGSLTLRDGKINAWNVSFKGKDLAIGDLFCQTAEAHLIQDGGEITWSNANWGLEGKASGKWDDFSAEMRAVEYPESLVQMRGCWDNGQVLVQIEKGKLFDTEFTGEGSIDPRFDCAFRLEGTWTLFDQRIPFLCPQFEKRGSLCLFDVRIERKMWDILRLSGMVDGSEISFDRKSHFLGAPISLQCDLGRLLDAKIDLSPKALTTGIALMHEWGFVTMPKITYPHPVEIHLQLNQSEDGTIDLTSPDFSMNAQMRKNGLIKGKSHWKGTAEVEFDGKVSPAMRFEFSLPKVKVDLSRVQWPYLNEGILEGQGHLVFEQKWEADFDLCTSALKIHGKSAENEGPIHLSYSSEKGAALHGLDLHGPFDCKIDLLEYHQSHWTLHECQANLPSDWIPQLPPFFKGELHFMGDLDFASDFSLFKGVLKEVSTSWANIHNLDFLWQEGQCKGKFNYLHLGQLIPLSFEANKEFKGIFTVGGLEFGWEYEDQFSIHSIEGQFAGIDASFRADTKNNLLGTAEIDFTVLSNYLPESVSDVFQKLNMGKGYELKGRLKLEDGKPHFDGLFTGKQLELLGYQFKSLFSEVDLSADRVAISDLKISDMAAILLIDQMRIEGTKENPWTISIPELKILELRPSLLRKVGSLETGPISPLVVRELKMIDFKGLLEEGKTYTAQGELHFINSYKRDTTIFDVPVDLFSRIFGLDFELLIPVCGALTFDLKDGYFHLDELKDAFSENQRSEFFLVKDECSPTMDLDGNLNILVSMKQFVLFKFTEAFHISIDGKLKDPQFHLQKKRRFF